MNDAAAEKHDFGAEVGRLLDLVVHSLYSEREIFLRELVANAADAMDRRRFESLTDSALAPPAEAEGTHRAGQAGAHAADRRRRHRHGTRRS